MAESGKGKFVIDASFFISYLLPDENDKKVENILGLYKKGKIIFYSSPIFPLEVLNGILAAYLRKRITEKFASGLIDRLQAIDIIYQNTDPRKIFALAIKENLSIYDASYLWLAKMNNTTLLTLDKNLIKITTK